MPLRTLQFRLRLLDDQGRLVLEGKGRWARYRPGPGPKQEEKEGGAATRPTPDVPLSEAGAAIQTYVTRSPETRKPVGYDRAFLEHYRPNDTYYLSEAERSHLAAVGRPQMAQQPAGTYAKQILNRLLIDLAWNSSRLEGNTYSLLDTRRLIEFGKEAEGREHIEAQMILNHKDAIEFLVSAAEDIGFNRFTLLNLHALLANNLLADPAAVGRLRYIPVGIERSAFHPLEMPQLIEECFDQILLTAEHIEDPFEQAFFVMVQLPYLQPFDDVNKRVSRLAANIPLIRNNLAPLSFTEVPREIYTQAILGIYELNQTELLRDVFVWAYERSAARYAAARQSLGDPDPFRLQYRTELRTVIGEIIRMAADRPASAEHLQVWASRHLPREVQAQFIEVAEAEIVSLHEGNFARYQVRPSEFAAWRKRWNRQ